MYTSSVGPQKGKYTEIDTSGGEMGKYTRLLSNVLVLPCTRGIVLILILKSKKINYSLKKTKKHAFVSNALKSIH